MLLSKLMTTAASEQTRRNLGLKEQERSVPVGDVIGAGVVHTNDDEDVLELRTDVLRREGQGARLLEDDGDDVVANVPLPQELGREVTVSDGVKVKAWNGVGPRVSFAGRIVEHLI